jgi:hypothetical protein
VKKAHFLLLLIRRISSHSIALIAYYKSVLVDWHTGSLLASCISGIISFPALIPGIIDSRVIGKARGHFKFLQQSWLEATFARPTISELLSLQIWQSHCQSTIVNGKENDKSTSFATYIMQLIYFRWFEHGNVLIQQFTLEMRPVTRKVTGEIWWLMGTP